MNAIMSGVRVALDLGSVLLRGFLVYKSCNKVCKKLEKSEWTAAEKVEVAADVAFIGLQSHGVLMESAYTETLAGAVLVVGSAAENVGNPENANWKETASLALWKAGPLVVNPEVADLLFQASREETWETVRDLYAAIRDRMAPEEDLSPSVNPPEKQFSVGSQQRKKGRLESADEQMQSLIEWESLEEIPRVVSAGFPVCKISGKPIRTILMPAFSSEPLLFEKREVEIWVRTRPNECPSWWPADKVPVKMEHFTSEGAWPAHFQKEINEKLQRFSASFKQAFSNRGK